MNKLFFVLNGLACAFNFIFYWGKPINMMCGVFNALVAILCLVAIVKD